VNDNQTKVKGEFVNESDQSGNELTQSKQSNESDRTTTTVRSSLSNPSLPIVHSIERELFARNRSKHSPIDLRLSEFKLSVDEDAEVAVAEDEADNSDDRQIDLLWRRKYFQLAVSQRLTTIDLSDMKLIEFPVELFELKDCLRELNLNHNRIRSLDYQPNSLNHRIGSSSDESVMCEANKQEFQLSVFQSLRKLSLVNNRLETLPAALFDCTSLIELDVSFNRLRVIEEQ
jgi:Leucine-rich repeat (LRR) protein